MTRTAESPAARYKAALAEIEAGRFDSARAALTRLGMEQPRAPEIPLQLSLIAGYRGDLATRLRQIDRALALKPDDPALLDAALAAFGVAGDEARVMALLDRRVAVAKTPLHAQTDKAIWLQHAGRFADAEELLRGLIARHPDEGVLYRTLFATLTVPADDPLMPGLERLLTKPKIPDAARLHGHFAMAKAREDQGAWEEVFPHLDAANRLQRIAAPYDRAAHMREQTAFRAAQDDATFAPPAATTDAPSPVFVIGPPRSGTTLAERILAGHAGVTAGGELARALRLVWTRTVSGDRVKRLSAMSGAELAALGARYRDFLRLDTGAVDGVVTDKSIQSHMVLGYLARALPDARFVAIRRDPRDTALSIYKNHFRTGTHRYATDLGDIAHALKSYRDSIAYWRARLPDRVTEIAYEDLVGDPNPTARRLAAAAGLDFAPESLDLAGGGTVRTLSVAQARQPIHAGRRAAWRRFETELQPFFDAWGDAPWD
ncbi:Sulfotransferase domain protein [Roseivivax jejudonensis]|uniref:Sulfotransferase domain protein n=1 Tax=Roseivivax jejudonensis TaxID=1529041 RepID=A0A1X6YEL7_9RHOB|nr:sulfotransferase [Roseivivax jejudonensis]SLN18379.1 Sulfotransferase domain protein [Roseivivax jejudonensis]